jgi:hypothetical protein
MEKSFSPDTPGRLCALFLLCGEKVYSWNRLKVVIYHLSAGSEKETSHKVTLFPYLFKENCYAGPDDDGLLNLIEWLRIVGYIKITTERIDSKFGFHTMYQITEKGKELGHISLAILDDVQRQALQESADSLKDYSNSVSRLINMYAKEWDKRENKSLTNIVM